MFAERKHENYIDSSSLNNREVLFHFIKLTLLISLDRLALFLARLISIPG